MDFSPPAAIHRLPQALAKYWLAAAPAVKALALKFGKALPGYGLAVALTVAALVFGMRLDKADFKVPFQYDYDALLILPFVKGTVERGSHWRNERLGAPGIQELHDFPVVDHLHFAVIWCLGQIWYDPVVVFNLFHLLTYPLTTLTTMFVLRRFGLSIPASMTGGMLYAFQPYHYLRGQVHYFLAAYYVVPITMMLALWICQGRLPFFCKQEDGTYRRALLSWDSLAAVVIAAATASAGAYYAFFACAFFVIAGIYGWVITKTWRAAASAAGVVGVTFVAGVLNHAPTFPYQYEYGRNSRPHVRMAEDSERYGLKIAQLVFPVAQHNPVGIADLVVLDPAALRSMYQAPQFKELNESEWDPLGLVASLGFVGLLAVAVVPVRKAWPFGPLSAFTVFGTLLGTTGGFGAVFNYTISSQVRCYNRISIYLAFLAIFAACWVVDRYFTTRVGRVRWLHWPACLAIIAFGLWDQTNDQWFPDTRNKVEGYKSLDDQRDDVAKRYKADHEFFQRVEALLPEDGMVFTYPYLEFPESQPYYETGAKEKIESYDPAVGYLHTRTTRWSFGAMKGREWDNWHRETCRLGLDGYFPRFLEKLCYGGFNGLLIDARGLNPKRFHELKAGIEACGASFREFHPGRKLYYFDLTNHLKLMKSFSNFEQLARADRESLTVLWLQGFQSYTEIGWEWKSHWGQKSGEIVFVNRSDRTITAAMHLTFRMVFKGTGRLRISGGEFWSDDLDIGSDPLPYARDLVIAPGRHTVRFRLSPKTSVMPSDSKLELYTITDFKLDERKSER